MSCCFKLNLYHIMGLDEQTSEFLFWLCPHWLVIWEKSLNFPACLFCMYKTGIKPLLLIPLHRIEVSAMFVTLFEKKWFILPNFKVLYLYLTTYYGSLCRASDCLRLVCHLVETGILSFLNTGRLRGCMVILWAQWTFECICGDPSQAM